VERHLKLRLLGRFDACVGDGQPVHLSTRKSQALLAYLAVRPGRAFTREALTELLWGDTGDDKARQSLRQALSTLRKALGDAADVLVDDNGLALRQGAVEVDVEIFERLIKEGSIEALVRATAMYGDLLEGFPLAEASFDEWLQAERIRIRDLALHAWSSLLAHRMALGQDDQAMSAASRVLSMEPFH